MSITHLIKFNCLKTCDTKDKEYWFNLGWKEVGKSSGTIGVANAMTTKATKPTSKPTPKNKIQIAIENKDISSVTTFSKEEFITAIESQENRSIDVIAKEYVGFNPFNENLKDYNSNALEYYQWVIATMSNEIKHGLSIKDAKEGVRKDLVIGCRSLEMPQMLDNTGIPKCISKLVAQGDRFATFEEALLEDLGLK